jgi:hypothetical protein
LVSYQPPPEKCDVNACANEPNPPRVTPLEPESDDVPDEEWLDESPLKKLLRDDDPPDEPWLLLDEDPRAGHSAAVCSPGGAAIPGRFGSQFSLGISAWAPPPMAKVPIRSSATWWERFTGADDWIASGLRVPNSLSGLSAMINRSSRRR